MLTEDLPQGNDLTCSDLETNRKALDVPEIKVSREPTKAQTVNRTMGLDLFRQM